MRIKSIRKIGVAGPGFIRDNAMVGECRMSSGRKMGAKGIVFRKHPFPTPYREANDNDTDAMTDGGQDKQLTVERLARHQHASYLLQNNDDPQAYQSPRDIKGWRTRPERSPRRLKQNDPTVADHVPAKPVQVPHAKSDARDGR